MSATKGQSMLGLSSGENAAATVTAANEGLSLSGTTVQLGNASQLSALPVITANRFIPGNFSVIHSASNVAGGNESHINPVFFKIVMPTAIGSSGFIMEGTNAAGSIFGCQYRNLSTAAAATVLMQMYIDSSVQDLEIIKHSNAHATYPGGTLLINKGAASAKLVLADTVTSGTPIIAFELNATERGRWNNAAFCINTTTATGYFNVVGDITTLAARISNSFYGLGGCLRIENLDAGVSSGADIRFFNNTGLKSQIAQYSTTGAFGANLFLMHNSNAASDIRLASNSGVVSIAIGGPDASFIKASFAATGLTLGLAANNTGTLSLKGVTSGVVTIQPQSVAGTYNFNLPTTAGSAGDILTSGGGGAAAMTYVAPGALTGLAYWPLSGTAFLTATTNIRTDPFVLTIRADNGGGEIRLDGRGINPIAIGDYSNTNAGIVQTFATDGTVNFSTVAFDGKVGINTATPTVALDVVGNGKILNGNAGLFVDGSTSTVSLGDINSGGNSTTVVLSDGPSDIAFNSTTVTISNLAGTGTRLVQASSAGLLSASGIILTGSASLNFGNTAAGASSDLTITVTGAAVGDVVTLGVPNGSVGGNGVFTAWVSAANTVTVRFTNTNLVAAIDPASGTFNVKVFQ